MLHIQSPSSELSCSLSPFIAFNFFPRRFQATKPRINQEAKLFRFRGPAMADVAMALATVFFCLLILSSAAISLLLLRLCRAALRPASSAALPPLPPPPTQELAFLVSPPPPPPPPFKEDELKKSMAAAAEGEEPRRLAWREVEALTGGFDEAAVVGRGGSSTVYLSTAASPVSPAAVKVQRWCGGGERRAAAFRRELGLLRRLRHPNLVALRAYSDDHGIILFIKFPPLLIRNLKCICSGL